MFQSIQSGSLTQVGIGQFCPPGNIWQCLQAFLVLQCGETSLAHKAEDKDTTNHAKIKMHRTGYYNKQTSDSESQQWQG